MDDLESADAAIRSAQAAIDESHLKLCGTASVILRRLRGQINRTNEAIENISKLDWPWARVASQQLQDAAEESKIRRGDREANMLLSLPENTGAAIAEWVRDMRLGDSNSDTLIAACRYGLNRLRNLQSVMQKVAAELLAIDAEQARICASMLQ